MATRSFRYLLAGAAAWMAFPGAAAATHLDGFVFDFTQGDPTGTFESFCRHPLPCLESSPPLTTIATSTHSGKYLGTFGEEVVSFHALDALNIIALQTDRAYLSFDLIMTGYWVGSADPGFETFLEVAANGKSLFDSTVEDLGAPRHFDLIFDFTPLTPRTAARMSRSSGPRGSARASTPGSSLSSTRAGASTTS
jgi:hypothetical protein